jgi:two-component system response regulator FixJ
MKTKPTVYVVDDDADLRDSLRYLIESEGLAVATYPSAQAFLAGYDAERPGCLVLDLRMPGVSGLDLQKHLRAVDSALPVVVLTAYGTVPAAVRAMKIGAVDFLQKGVSDEVLLDTIHKALDVNLHRRRDKGHLDEIRGRLGSLTRREHQVLDGIVAGKANKHMAQELGIAEKTVEVHRKHAMKKMKAKAINDVIRDVQWFRDHDDVEPVR